MKSTFSEIKSIVDQLAANIDAPEEQLPTYGFSKDGGFPHIEISRDGIVYYVAVERGSETFRYKPSSMDDLLYKIFEGVMVDGITIRIKEQN